MNESLRVAGEKQSRTQSLSPLAPALREEGSRNFWEYQFSSLASKFAKLILLEVGRARPMRSKHALTCPDWGGAHQLETSASSKRPIALCSGCKPSY